MPILPSAPPDYDHYSSPPPVAVRILAAHEWSRLLNTHGSNGETDPVRAGMMHLMIGLSAAKNQPTAEQRAAFARALVTLGGGVVTTEGNYGGTTHTSYHHMTELSVDYSPGLWLPDLAEAAGLPKQMVWPMKTNSRLGTDHFCLRAGYRAGAQYLYPLADGRVLVSTEPLGVSADWVANACAAIGFPPSVYVAKWNWRMYAVEIGVNAETGEGE